MHFESPYWRWSSWWTTGHSQMYKCSLRCGCRHANRFGFNTREDVETYSDIHRIRALENKTNGILHQNQSQNVQFHLLFRRKPWQVYKLCVLTLFLRFKKRLVHLGPECPRQVTEERAAQWLWQLKPWVKPGTGISVSEILSFKVYTQICMEFIGYTHIYIYNYIYTHTYQQKHTRVCVNMYILVEWRTCKCHRISQNTIVLIYVATTTLHQKGK